MQEFCLLLEKFREIKFHEFFWRSGLQYICFFKKSFFKTYFLENGNGTAKNGSSGDDNGLKRKPAEDDDDDIIIEVPAKKAKTVAPAAIEEDQDIVCLE